MTDQPEKMTCEDYAIAFASNQDHDDLRADYPDGLSINAIRANDSFCVMSDPDDENILIEPYGERIQIIDPENRDLPFYNA